MPSSGTWNFNPGLGSMSAYALGMAGVRRSAILQEHIEDARMAANLLLIDWASNTGVNLWTVDLQTVPLVQGVAEYSIDAQTIMVLDGYIRTFPDGVTPQDRIVWPMSRTEWASQPSKTMQAPPTMFWFDRLIAPTVTVWPVPDDQGPYTLHFYRCRMIQDAVMAGGTDLDVQRRLLDAFAHDLAARLAITYAPDRAEKLAGLAYAKLMKATGQDVENVDIYITPGLSGYYRVT